MKHLKWMVAPVAFWMIISCNAEKLGEAGQADSVAAQSARPLLFQDSVPVSDQASKDPDTVIHIRFAEFTLLINRLVVVDEEGKLRQIQPDSTGFFAEIGETIEGQTVSVSNNYLSDLRIEQRYETSVVISNEGPYCDLTEWKHYYSPWKPLNRSSNGNFICMRYSLKESELFPNIPLSQIKEAVRKQCGDQWYQLVKNIDSPNQYPSSVGISRYFLRISGKRKDTGKRIKKIITIQLPMGC